MALTLSYSLASERSASAHNETLAHQASEILKSIMFYTHQNFLILIDVIIQRLPPESTVNIWAHSL
jgi:hypothetical protein